MAARTSLRALGLEPGAASLRLAVGEFSKDGPGVVTSFSDDILRCLRDLIDEDEEDLEPLDLGTAVRRFLSLCDENPRGNAGGGHYTAAIAQAAEGLDADSPFSRSAKFPGFHKAAVRTLRELHAWKIGPDELEEAACKAGNAKLASLAFLEREARQTIESLGRELNSVQMQRSIDCRPAQGGSFKQILVLAGSCDQPLAAQWLRWLAEAGADVTVVVDMPHPSGLFSGSQRFAEMLGVEIERRGGTSGLCEALFTDNEATGGPEVKITSCADALAEAEWAIRGCLQDLARGLAPEDISIYARNLEEYAPYLEAAAKRLNVRLRMARRAPVITNRFARLAQEALDFCSSDDLRKLIPLLGCSYLGLSRIEARDIRDAVQTAYKARKNSWPVLTGWAEAKQQQFPWLHRLMSWREEASRSPLPLYAWNDRLRSLVDLLPWHGAEGPGRVRDHRAASALQRAIASVASVRGAGNDPPIVLHEFASLCREVWKDEQYTVPAAESGIPVVSSAQCLGEVKSLYALGMLEGVFPRRRSEDPILNDEDRDQLSKALDLHPPLPNSFDHAREERDEFYRLCASTSGSITLSYPLADDARDNVPAFYLHEIERAMAAKVHKHDYPRIPFAPEAEECIAISDRELRSSLDGDREDPLPVQFLRKEVRDELAWPEDRPFTPQDLREALRCEFKHFVSKRLGLRPSRQTSRWSSLRKLPQSVRLLHQPTPDVARHAMETALEAELDLLYGEVPDWELAMMRSGGKRLISEWVKREFAARDLWPKEESTLKVDLPFGAPGIRDRMPGGVPLMGTLAGVSRMGPYAVAHLYESRPPKQEGRLGGVLDELDTLYYGLHLLSRHDHGAATAVEVESMSGTRTLLVLPRLPEMPLPSRHQEGLNVVDLSGGADGPLAKKAFYDEVKRRLARAVSRLKASGVEPIKGEHCTWCGYGELCRRSLEFGEEDSPFEIDAHVFEVD